MKKRTLLAPEDIVELLEFVLTTTYFAFGGQVYQQKFGTAMGSPVSPIVANLFMEHLEQRATVASGEQAYIVETLYSQHIESDKKRESGLDEWSAHLDNMDPTGSI